MQCLRRQRHMEREEVSARKNVIKILVQLDLERTRSAWREGGIVSDRPHSKGDRAPRNLGPDSSHFQNPDGFPMKFNAFITLAIPLARFDAIMRLRNIARN